MKIFCRKLKQLRTGKSRFSIFQELYQSFLHLRLFPVNSTEKIFLLKNIDADSSFKAAYFMSLTGALYSNTLKPRNQRHKICKEIFITIPKVIYARKQFFLLDEISDKIEMLKASGLIEFWYYRDDKRVENTRNPKNLSLNDFKGCFIVLLSGFVVGCFALIMEIVLKFLSNFK
jgi:hypothetical protein